MDRPTILVANAGKDLLSRLRVLMSSPDMEMLGLDSEADVVSRLQERPPNLVIACSNGGDARRGLELIRQVRQLSKLTPVVFITGQSSERLAIEALRAGADDYFKFPFSDNSLQTSFKRLKLLRTSARRIIRFCCSIGVRQIPRTWNALQYWE